jgi:hypothetical protein
MICIDIQGRNTTAEKSKELVLFGGIPAIRNNQPMEIYTV